MKLWLDDQFDDPAAPDRRPPPGYVGVHTPRECIRLLKQGRVTYLSLDHDLAPGVGNGELVLRWLEKHLDRGDITVVPEMDVHSYNPVGHARMLQAIGRIYAKAKDWGKR